MKLFSLNASKPFADRVAGELGATLSAHEERDFEDTEFKVRPLVSMRGEQVFLIQSLYWDARQSVNDKLCRLLFFVGALKDAGAGHVTAVVPYLAYARKDRRTKSRDPVTTRYVASMFEAVALDAVLTMDVHNLAAYENAFRCGKEHVEAAPLFVDHFTEALDLSERIVVLSPDAGGVKRARSFADLLAVRFEQTVELAFMEKQRSEGRIRGEAFAGDVEGATVIVVDDLISGGSTVARAVRACKDRGAVRVHAVATHGVFGRGANERLTLPELSSVVITDTVGDAKERCSSLASKLVVLDSAQTFAHAIRRLTLDG